MPDHRLVLRIVHAEHYLHIPEGDGRYNHSSCICGHTYDLWQETSGSSYARFRFPLLHHLLDFYIPRLYSPNRMVGMRR